MDNIFNGRKQEKVEEIDFDDFEGDADFEDELGKDFEGSFSQGFVDSLEEVDLDDIEGLEDEIDLDDIKFDDEEYN